MHTIAYYYMQELTNGAMPETSIRVKTRTRNRLNQIGKRNESYDEIINRLIDNEQSPPGSI